MLTPVSNLAVLGALLLPFLQGFPQALPSLFSGGTSLHGSSQAPLCSCDLLRWRSGTSPSSCAGSSAAVPCFHGHRELCVGDKPDSLQAANTEAGASQCFILVLGFEEEKGTCIQRALYTESSPSHSPGSVSVKHLSSPLPNLLFPCFRGRLHLFQCNCSCRAVAFQKPWMDLPRLGVSEGPKGWWHTASAGTGAMTRAE